MSLSSPSSPPPLSDWGVTEILPKSLRQVLGSYPTGVAIVTARALDGRPCGLTINSFAALSLEPALILWSLGAQSPHAQTFRDAGHFAISVLGAGQLSLAQRFATAGLPDKFEGVAWRDAPEGVPVMLGAVATLVCSPAQTSLVGDHWLFVGRVQRMDLGDGPPLVFHGGRFTALAPRPELV